MITITMKMISSVWARSHAQPAPGHGTGSARAPIVVATVATMVAVRSTPASTSHQPMALPGTRETSSAPTPRGVSIVAAIRISAPGSDGGLPATSTP